MNDDSSTFGRRTRTPDEHQRPEIAAASRRLEHVRGQAAAPSSRTASFTGNVFTTPSTPDLGACLHALGDSTAVHAVAFAVRAPPRAYSAAPRPPSVVEPLGHALRDQREAAPGRVELALHLLDVALRA